MRVLLCTPDCGPLPPEDWSLIRYDLGFAGIRTDVRRPSDAAPLVANVAGCAAYGLFIADARSRADTCLAIVEALAQAIRPLARPQMLAIEVGNEPDRDGRWRADPAGYGQLVQRACDVVRRLAPGAPVVTGGIGTLSPDALRWLGLALAHVPRDVAVGYHPYRDGGPRVPRPGYSSREAEMQALATVAGGRALWCTEIGWSTAPRRRDFPLCFTRTAWSDGEVAAFLREELRIEERSLAEVACVYQLQDGPHATEMEDRFGIRRTDGALKPAAYAAREWRA